MSDSQLGTGRTHYVAHKLIQCKSLKEIHLSNCEITDSGAEALFEELREIKTIAIINLD